MVSRNGSVVSPKCVKPNKALERDGTKARHPLVPLR